MSLVEDIDKVEASAVRILAARDHSRGELRKKLSERGFEQASITQVLDKLEERGWLNDVEFASRQAEILAGQEWGPSKIVQKLMDHGVEFPLARRVVDELEIPWIEQARARVERRFGALDSQSEKARAFRHLCGRGFTQAMARKVVFSE